MDIQKQIILAMKKAVEDEAKEAKPKSTRRTAVKVSSNSKQPKKAQG